MPRRSQALERQRLNNLTETYLPGPPKPIDALGARVLELIPLAPLAGNLGLSFVALSYAGSLGLTVRADADQFPDLDVLVAALERDWRLLAETCPGGAKQDSTGASSCVTTVTGTSTARSRRLGTSICIPWRQGDRRNAPEVMDGHDSRH